MARAELLDQGVDLCPAGAHGGFFTTEAGTWPDGSSSDRKRIFSPGFIVLCVFVSVAELVALNLPYGVIDEMSQ